MRELTLDEISGHFWYLVRLVEKCLGAKDIKVYFFNILAELTRTDLDINIDVWREF